MFVGRYNFQSILGIIILAMLLMPCSCVTYYPQAVDVPLIKGKGDMRLDAGGFMVPNINPNDEDHSVLLADFGIHSTFTAGITDLLAVQAHVSMDVISRAYVHGAFGIYKSFSEKTVMELYGGIGYGSGLSNGIKNEPMSEYLLTFAQYNIGQSGLGKSNIDYGMGLRGGYINTYYKGTYSDGLEYQQNGWMAEPTIFIRLGGRRAKYSVKVIYLWTETITKEYYFPLSVSMGVNFHVGKKNRK